MSRAMADLPSNISVYIEWDFEMSAPSDINEFIVEAIEYQHEWIRDLPWYSPMRWYWAYIQTNLKSRFPVNNVLLKYHYARQPEPGAEWTNHEGAIEIFESETLTYGKILYYLHHKTSSNLHYQDYMAIEEFEYLGQTEDDGIPIYKVWFGS